jgi:hypothetical protein
MVVIHTPLPQTLVQPFSTQTSQPPCLFSAGQSAIGAVQGMITGLVAITPAAGVVAGWGAICIGFASGTIPVRTLLLSTTFLKFLNHLLT